MSEDDRQRWNARYRDGAFESRTHPNAFLAEQSGSLAAGSRVLDLACGSGRNARYLASLGHSVHAVDVSDEGLARVNPDGLTSLSISTERVDLESEWAPGGTFDAIIILRYLNLSLVERAVHWLNPGGLLLVEVHLQHPTDDLAGPRSSRFRAEPGAVQRAARELHPVHSVEGLVTDPDGSSAAVARLVAQKPP